MIIDMINHSSHSHPATSAARAACRKALAASQDRTQLDRLIMVMGQGYQPAFRQDGWLFAAARRWGRYEGTDRDEAARAIQAHFYPSGDAARDAGRRQNGWTVTDDPYTIKRITLTAFS